MIKVSDGVRYMNIYAKVHIVVYLQSNIYEVLTLDISLPYMD